MLQVFKNKNNITYMRLAFLLSFFLIYSSSYGQKNKDLDVLIYLGTIVAEYNRFPTKNAPDDLLKELAALKNENCQFAIDFTLESLKKPNNLLDKKYLEKQSKVNLEQIYIIEIAQGFSLIASGGQLKELVKNNSKGYPSHYDLLDTYYSMLFNMINSRNRESVFSISNLDLESYKLKDDTEKAIFYFRYMNMISKNTLFPILTGRDVTDGSCSEFEKFPTINGKDFYYYANFGFKDFPSRLANMDGSYKHYYIDETYKLIFTYIKCREQNFISKGDISNIVENSILENHELQKYCENMDILEEIRSKYGNK